MLPDKRINFDFVNLDMPEFKNLQFASRNSLRKAFYMLDGGAINSKAVFARFEALKGSMTRFVQCSNLLEKAAKGQKLLEFIDLFVLIYDAYQKLPRINRHKPYDVTLNEFWMKNGKCDLPNVEIGVDLEDEAWVTTCDLRGFMSSKYILQRSVHNHNYARILKAKYQSYVQIAHGTYEAMEEKLHRLQQKTFYRSGDLIYIDRDDVKVPMEEIKKYLKRIDYDKSGSNILQIPFPIYAHVGVYIGNREVIHFVGDGDMTGERSIRLTTLDEFLEKHKRKVADDKIYVMHFPGDGKRPYKLYPNTNNLPLHPAHFEFFELVDCSTLKCFTPAETVARAKEKLVTNDFGKYDIAENNCEHFATWCKTDTRFSIQAENIQKIIDIVVEGAKLIAKDKALLIEGAFWAKSKLKRNF